MRTGGHFRCRVPCVGRPVTGAAAGSRSSWRRVAEDGTSRQMTREIFGFVPMWQSIEALDNKVDDAVQSEMLIEASGLLERGFDGEALERRVVEMRRERDALHASVPVALQEAHAH